MTKTWKVTAQSTKGEVSSIIRCDDENEAWTRAHRLFGGKVWNGTVERYPLYDEQAARIAALEMQNAELLVSMSTALWHLEMKGEKNEPAAEISRA